jgi:hypothetical protein
MMFTSHRTYREDNMKPTVRFVEDDNPYVAGDFGDQGVEEMARIQAGAVIVVGMVVFDADAVDESERDRNPEAAINAALLDSLWCIAVQSDALNDLGKDITDPSVVRNDYLRHLATEALSTMDSGDVNRG